MRLTWLRFGIVTTVVALAIASVLLSRRANEISRERKAIVRLEQGEAEARIDGKPDESEPVKEFFAGEGVTDVEFSLEVGDAKELEPERLEALGDLPRLERLSIYTFDLDWPHVDAIPTLPTVREFNWRPSEPARYDGDKAAELCGKMPNLEALGLIDLQISDQELSSIPRLRELNDLYLHTDGVTGEFLGSLAGSRLESLRIYGDDLTLDGFERLADIKTLRMVEFGHVHLPHEALDVLPRLAHIEELSFHLVSGPIPQERLDALNQSDGERYESLWPESSTEIGGDGWTYLRGKVGTRGIRIAE